MTLMRFASVLGLCGILSGCETFGDEVGVSEGLVSRHANKVIVATSQRQRADRYLLAGLLLAPLALDAAQDETDADTAITRLNAHYQTMADLYEAIAKCSTTEIETKEADENNSCRAQHESDPAQNKALDKDGYSFEVLAYEVQSDLYFLGKSALINLDLDDKVKDVIDLDPIALVSLLRELGELAPTLRRGLATYRDGIVIYTDAVYESVEDGCENEKPKPKLCSSFKKRYSRIGALTDEEGNPVRGLSKVLADARQDASGKQWQLSKRQRYAILSHMDTACARAYRMLSDSDGTDCLNLEGRKKLVTAFQNKPIDS